MSKNEPPQKPPKFEMLEVDDTYQNVELAQQAFYLRTHIKVLWEEVNKFEEMVKAADAPQPVKDWLMRVHGNTSRYFPGAMNNLDQVRAILDKENQGKLKG